MNIVNETLITIPGVPIPLKRHRVSKGRTYDPQSDIKEDIYWIIREQIKAFPLKEIVTIELTFFMRIPKSLSKKKQLALDGKPHCKKPDIDNLIKFYLDVCNGVLYKDDSQIYKINATKIYSEKPQTKLIIKYGVSDNV